VFPIASNGSFIVPQGKTEVLITGTGNIVLSKNDENNKNNHDNEAKIYKIIPQKNSITITDFDRNRDVVDLTLFFSKGIRSVTDLNYRTIPLTIILSKDQRIVFSSLDDFQWLSAENFRFAVNADKEGGNGGHYRLRKDSSFWISLALLVVCILFVVGLLWLPSSNKKDDEDKKTPTKYEGTMISDEDHESNDEINGNDRTNIVAEADDEQEEENDDDSLLSLSEDDDESDLEFSDEEEDEDLKEDDNGDDLEGFFHLDGDEYDIVDNKEEVDFRTQEDSNNEDKDEFNRIPVSDEGSVLENDPTPPFPALQTPFLPSYRIGESYNDHDFTYDYDNNTKFRNNDFRDDGNSYHYSNFPGFQSNWNTPLNDFPNNTINNNLSDSTAVINANAFYPFSPQYPHGNHQVFTQSSVYFPNYNPYNYYSHPHNERSGIYNSSKYDNDNNHNSDGDNDQEKQYDR
jgi:hypothetical protein